MVKPVAAKFQTPSMGKIPEEVSYLDPGLTRMSDEQLTCMAEGHDWPRLRLNRIVPKGFRSLPNADGTSLWIYTCGICGTTRRRMTLRYGLHDPEASYSYTYPDTWIHYTLEDEISRARLKREVSKRMYEAIQRQSKME